MEHARVLTLFLTFQSRALCTTMKALASMKSTTFSWIPDNSQFGAYEVNLMTYIRDSLNEMIDLVSRNGCDRRSTSSLCQAFQAIGSTPRINVLWDGDTQNPDYGLVETQLITRFKETMSSLAHAISRASCT